LDLENLKTKDTYLDDKNIVLGLSGGIDSVVLLHYLHRHYPQRLRVIHCNHHLSKYCDEWQLFCQKLCENLNIPYKNIDLHFKSSGNIEENARKKRYLSLSCDLKETDVLCTAHHQTDQAETLLLQLFRGSGVAGLASMPKQKSLGKAVHYRPLLDVEKHQIINYAKHHKLNWIEDDSNKNTHFRRNFLRLNIIPTLSTVYKNLVPSLARSVKHQADALKLTRELAQIDIKTYQIINAEGRICIENLIKLTPHRIKNVLRYQLNCLHFLTPNSQIMAQIMALLLAKSDANPLVRWANFEIRRYQKQLYFMDKTAHKNPEKCPIHAELEKLGNFSIRYRTEGQRVKLPNKKHSQTLKKVLQEANIVPWERNSLKMYYIDDELRAMERLGAMRRGEKSDYS
jgi:tRNA(Ile)-lysidine synthase